MFGIDMFLNGSVVYELAHMQINYMYILSYEVKAYGSIWN